MSIALQKRGRKEPPEEKKKELEYLISLAKNKKYIIFADLHSLPAKQLQIIKKQLRNEAVFRVSRKNLVIMALEKIGLKKEQLIPYIKNGVMVIFTDTNP
ncbi:MAG: 50S ribosomal protein L10, partial [Caldisphaera sp.]|nr:50S ribosomal protein L10 [Caldisphaera sp.]